MSQYNAEALFHSVNDIFEQLDEGKISEAIANDILSACCKVFVETVERNKQKYKPIERKRVFFEYINEKDERIAEMDIDYWTDDTPENACRAWVDIMSKNFNQELTFYRINFITEGK
jgi:hypothetical protein